MTQVYCCPVRSLAIALVGVVLAFLTSVGATQDSGLIQPQQRFEDAKARGDWPAAIEFGELALERARD